MTAFLPAIVDALVEQLATATGVDAALPRRLHVTDPNKTVGVAFAGWMPLEAEMVGRVISPPSLARYSLVVQTLVKHTKEIDALALHATITKSVRSLLYSSAPLRDALLSSSETTDGFTERATRYGVRSQKFNSGELKGGFTYLSATELWLETSTDPT